MYSISYLVTSLFSWSTSSWFSFIGCKILESCIFLPHCQLHCHIIVHSILAWCFVLLQYPLWFFLFHFLFWLFFFSLFFLVSLGRGLSVLFILSKNKLLILLIFSLILNLYFIISSLIFMISILLLTLGLFCSFSNSFRWWLSCQFEIFFEEGLYCYEFPSVHCFCGIP